jgi:hypothetical protein
MHVGKEQVVFIDTRQAAQHPLKKTLPALKGHEVHDHVPQCVRPLHRPVRNKGQ